MSDFGDESTVWATTHLLPEAIERENGKQVYEAQEALGRGEHSRGNPFTFSSSKVDIPAQRAKCLPEAVIALLTAEMKLRTAAELCAAARKTLEK